MQTHNNAATRTDALAYSLDDAAKALSVSKRTVQSLVSNGELASIKIKSRRVIPVSALLEFVNQQRVG
jgi:excisionase family DNA binding protein